jgi:glycosyltransferase involved in cell wall biosynthesis
MRIAYVAPYQGPTLLNSRPIVRNRSMSNKVKIELIATLLRTSGHAVEIISQGEVVDCAYTFYPSLSEREPFWPDIPIRYGSVLPIRRLNGLWSNARTLHILRKRHDANPYDLVIIFNLKGPQLACAKEAVGLGLHVILEYEDDRFVDVGGEAVGGFSLKRDMRAARRVLRMLSGCMAVSPHLLSQVSPEIPTLLLRGVVGSDLVKAAREGGGERRNIVLFSGTHIASNGVEELIQGWRGTAPAGWELHITGQGQLSGTLREMAQGVPAIEFHGLVSRQELLRLMCAAKICINPHRVSRTPGNVFAFKIIEYLAAGAHVISTPMGILEPDIETGVTYMPDNTPATIAANLKRVIRERRYERRAAVVTQRAYGPEAVSRSLETLLHEVMGRRPAGVVHG